VGWLFEYIGNIFLLLCLVDLGLSFLYVWNRDRTGHSIVRIVTAGLGVVLFALAIGHFGKLEGVRTEYYNSINDSGSNSLDFEIYFTLRKLSAAFDILLWVASLAVLALTIYVLVISRQKTQLRQVSLFLSALLCVKTARMPANLPLLLCQNAILFLVIGILYLLRNTWELAYDATWGLKNNPFLTVPLYIQVLDPILDIWTTFVILVLVFVIGCRKRDGLWTTHQPWMANYGGGAPQVQQPQQVWPAPMNSVLQQGYAEYNHQAPPVQPQMQPGWQQPVYYYPQANQAPPGVQSEGMPQPGSPMNVQHHELGIK
jgi:hypothetical protein